jgi:hypothetical protein
MNEFEPKKLETVTAETLAGRISLAWNQHIERVNIDRLPDVDASLSFWEKIYYIHLKGVLKIISLALTGSLYGAAASAASNMIPDIEQTEGSQTMDTKPFYWSKTLWVNVIGVAWMLLEKPLGLPTLGTETEATILGVLNVILRFVTKTDLTIA